MRPLSALALYLVVVLVGGALLAPWLQAAVGALAGHFESFQNLARQPFSRYLTRCFLIIALLGLWPLARVFGLTRWSDLGLRHPAGQWRWAMRGFLLGFCGLALVLAIALVAGARTWDGGRSADQVLRHLVNASAAAVVVGILEEILFRGAIFGAFSRVYPFPTALLTSSVVFALVHFFAKVQWTGPVGWDAGLRALPQLLAGFTDLRQLVPGFFNLALAGIILAVIYHRTGSLYGSIGLHAGWIFWLKTGGFFTRLDPAATPWLWGGAKLLDGWLVLSVLGLTLGLSMQLFPGKALTTKYSNPGLNEPK